MLMIFGVINFKPTGVLYVIGGIDYGLEKHTNVTGIQLQSNHFSNVWNKMQAERQSIKAKRGLHIALEWSGWTVAM